MGFWINYFNTKGKYISYSHSRNLDLMRMYIICIFLLLLIILVKYNFLCKSLRDIFKCKNWLYKEDEMKKNNTIEMSILSIIVLLEIKKTSILPEVQEESKFSILASKMWLPWSCKLETPLCIMSVRVVSRILDMLH